MAMRIVTRRNAMARIRILLVLDATIARITVKVAVAIIIIFFFVVAVCYWQWLSTLSKHVKLILDRLVLARAASTIKRTLCILKAWHVFSQMAFYCLLHAIFSESLPQLMC